MKKFDVNREDLIRKELENEKTLLTALEERLFDFEMTVIQHFKCHYS
jgi:hypothetical protein